jgi:hypothetical protein
MATKPVSSETTEQNVVNVATIVLTRRAERHKGFVDHGERQNRLRIKMTTWAPSPGLESPELRTSPVLGLHVSGKRVL